MQIERKAEKLSLLRGLVWFHPSSTTKYYTRTFFVCVFMFSHSYAALAGATARQTARQPRPPTCLPPQSKKTQLLSAGRDSAQAQKLSFSASQRWPESEAGIQNRARRLDWAGPRQKRSSAGDKAYTKTRRAAKFSFSASQRKALAVPFCPCTDQLHQ